MLVNGHKAVDMMNIIEAPLRLVIISDAVFEDRFVRKVKLQKQQPMYQPTNAQLNEQPNGQYIATFNVELYNQEGIREVANFMVENIRVILWEVTGPESGSTVSAQVESAPYTRGDEDEVELIIAKGGKLIGTARASYA